MQKMLRKRTEAAAETPGKDRAGRSAPEGKSDIRKVPAGTRRRLAIRSILADARVGASRYVLSYDVQRGAE